MHFLFYRYTFLSFSVVALLAAGMYNIIMSLCTSIITSVTVYHTGILRLDLSVRLSVCLSVCLSVTAGQWKQFDPATQAVVSRPWSV